jgi:vacuolar-type H+-ATPase subunit D/Vma8
MSIFFWRDLGDELIKTGASIKAASQIIKEINNTLREMPMAIETLVIALHETDQLLQNAGKNVNSVKIPAIDFDYANVVGVKVISNISVEDQSVFEAMGDDLIKSGQQLHESEKQFNTLKDQIHKFSKPNGPLDDLTTVVMNPLAVRLIGLGKRMR